MTSAAIGEGIEFVLVNVTTATLLSSWTNLGGLKTILILSAIIFNVVRVYGWFEKRSKDKKAAKALEKRQRHEE